MAPPAGGRYRRLKPYPCLPRTTGYVLGSVSTSSSVSTIPDGTTLSDQPSSRTPSRLLDRVSDGLTGVSGQLDSVRSCGRTEQASISRSAPPSSAPVRLGLTAAYVARPARTSGDRLRGRRHRRRDRQDRRVRRLPLRPRRAPLLHEAQARSSASGMDLLGPELLRRPRLSRIYYQGEFFAYPLAAKDVVSRLGFVEAARCALSYVWSRPRRHLREPADLRGLGDEPLRPPPLRRVLPLLHGEGLGHPRLRDPLRVGRAADQGLLALQGDAHDPRAGAGNRSRR